MRALHADQRPIAPDIQDRPLTLSLHPLEVAILVAGIHDQEVAPVRLGIDKDIVDDAALLVAEQGVLDPAGLQTGEVTSHYTLGEALIDDAQFAHMRKVEEADGFPHGTVLPTDAAVLQRHHPTAEVRHLGTEADVFVVERCPLGGHDQTLRLFIVEIVQVVHHVEIVEELLVVHHTRLPQHREDDAHPRFLPLQQLGQFRRRGRPPQAFRKQALRRFQQAAGDDERLIVALGLLGLGEHVVHSGRNRVDEAGMEPAIAGLVMLDGRDQADRPFLEQVAKGDATRPAGVGGFQHQVEVVLDQDPVRLVAARPLGGQEALLFAVGQPWVARDLRPVVLLLVV